jgi:hypothetical protein
MKRFDIRFIVIVMICLAQSPTIARPNEPVAMLMKGDGEIFFSHSGLKWDLMDRNKFLFPGNQIKTGNNSGCKLIFEDSDYSKYIESNSQVIVQDEDVKVLSGNVSTKDKIFDIMSNLKRKFATIQKYTTVLRSSKQKNINLNLPPLLCLCDAYPTLAWENVGPHYNYQLTIRNKRITIPKSKNPYIRYQLEQMPAGEYFYEIAVMEGTQVIVTASSTFKWLTKEETKSILEQEHKIRSVSNQGFLLGNLMDEAGLKIAALDHYLNYFSNAYHFEMRPFLIKVYKELGMLALADKEIMEFNKRR